MAKKNKPQKWIKPRHAVVRTLAYPFLRMVSNLKYGAKIEPFKDQKKGQPYLILFNHQTGFDQFFVSFAFKGPVYYVATEDIFSMGFVSKLLRYAVAPIPIRKQTTDVHAVMNCRKVAKEGGTIAIAPEGNRTYSGKTEYINPAIVGLIKLLKLPLVFYRLEGGYGVQPRWSDSVRKGKMRCYVSKVVEPEEYARLSDDELLTLVQDELYVNEGVADAAFTHKRLAEGLERAMYVCPDCGITVFDAKKDVLTCTRCGKQVRYLPTKELEGIGSAFPYRFTTEWYDAQCDFMRNLDLNPYMGTPIFAEKDVLLSEVQLYKRKKPISKNAQFTAYGDRFELAYGGETITLGFDKLSAVTVLGKNKVNLYFDKTVWQIKGDKHMNAVKFVNLFYHHKNTQAGEPNGKFLGL